MVSGASALEPSGIELTARRKLFTRKAPGNAGAFGFFEPVFFKPSILAAPCARGAHRECVFEVCVGQAPTYRSRIIAVAVPGHEGGCPWRGVHGDLSPKVGLAGV